jgi:EAL domain-containing protein (putative c-di-GMP-specific phosphodiesterase class I)
MEPEGLVANSIRALAALGVRFAIDDFGTGYSSLSYLKHFPVGSLKIDRTFVRHLPGNPDDAAIASAIVALGRALDLDIVAEGVETVDQAKFLAGIGCDKIQGYLVGQPLVPAALEALRAAGSLPIVRMLSGVSPGRGLGEPPVPPRPYESIVPQARIGVPDPVDLV